MAFAALLLALALAQAAPAASGGPLRLNAAGSEVRASFSGPFFPTYTVRFDRVAGRLEPRGAAEARLRVEVDPRSIRHSGSAVGRQVTRLLEPARYPEITFTAERVRVADGGQTVEGELLLHGVRRPATVTVQLAGVGGAEVRFSGQSRIRRSQFGMGALRGFARDEVDLAFRGVFRAD